MIALRAIREAAGLTQVQVADRLGTTQGQVSRMESQQDWLLSTLAAYLEAVGAQAELVVKPSGRKPLRLHLTERGNQ